jgi:hypothetical protein
VGFVLVDFGRSRCAPYIYSIKHCPLSLHPQTEISLRPSAPYLSATNLQLCTGRMYRNFPQATDQSCWSEYAEVPFVFPPSPTSSNGSRIPPQMKLDLYDPNASSFDENRSNDSQDFYASLCAAISTPPERGDEWDRLNFSQLLSANPDAPPAGPSGQTFPGQQFVFGDGQSSFAFNTENLWPLPRAHENHIPTPISPLSMPDTQAPPQHTPLPPLPLLQPPRDSSSFSQNSQLDDPISLACPTSSEPVSTPNDPPFQGDSPVMATPPQPRPIQRSPRPPSKKRKADQADSDDESVRAFLSFSRLVLNCLRQESRYFSAA